MKSPQAIFAMRIKLWKAPNHPDTDSAIRQLRSNNFEVEPDSSDPKNLIIASKVLAQDLWNLDAASFPAELTAFEARVVLSGLELPHSAWRKFRSEPAKLPVSADGCLWLASRQESSLTIFAFLNPDRAERDNRLRLIKANALMMLGIDRLTRMIPGAMDSKKSENFYRALNKMIPSFY